MNGSLWNNKGLMLIIFQYCDKSIRGDTQYRIHLTTNQHLKVGFFLLNLMFIENISLVLNLS